MQKKPFLKEHYPVLAECIDTGIADYNKSSDDQVKYGIGQYWQARLVTEFSKEDLTMFQYLRDLSPFVWINNPDTYRDRYDFAVVPHRGPEEFMIDRRQIEKFNGVPTSEFVCWGEATVLIYGKGKINVKKTTWQVGESNTWLGCELPTLVGHYTEACGVSKSDDTNGYLSYGPYEALPAGKYAVEIDYISDALTGADAGLWDVVLALPDQAKELNSGKLTGTANLPNKISAEFVIPKEYNMEKIEVRNVVNSIEGMTIVKVKVSRIN